MIRTQMIQIVILVALVLTGLFVINKNCYADTESENAILARIIHELDAIQPLVNAAEKQQPTYSRIRFNYALLRCDLNKIKIGIKQQLTQEPIEPRSEAPITGDYIDLERLKS